MQELQKSILKTLAWFDMFDFPLKLEEVEKYLLNHKMAPCLSDRQAGTAMEPTIDEEIEKLIDQEKISKKDEFYFLFNREEIVKIREHRKKISLKKIKKAKRLVKFLKLIPSIKAIFLCNSVGYLNAKANSDIDLFIITATNRIWTARWWSVGWLKLFNLRPSARNKKDKFCLSYFVTEDNLNLEKTKIRQDDISLIYWLTTFRPLYYKNNLWEKFVKANEWATEQNDSRQSHGANNLNLQEKILKKIQLWYMPKELKNAAKENNNKVIINDKMLKFHLTDKRQEDFEKWTENYERF